MIQITDYDANQAIAHTEKGTFLIKIEEDGLKVIEIDRSCISIVPVSNNSILLIPTKAGGKPRQDRGHQGLTFAVIPIKK